MARRYVIHIAPVRHLNGKLAPSDVVCHNQPDTDESDVSFYYGYRYARRPETSRYAIRDKARNLSVHPYTQGEQDTKDMLTQCVATAQHLLSNPTIKARIRRDFNAQRRYIRVYNFTIATLILNQGVIPPHWRL